ncbi:MAG: hypothetical protein JWM68_2598 [Verrucomicrobiales bacterium]|nr:hypothetical protein [Verrucomicrobiales bacterium]
MNRRLPITIVALIFGFALLANGGSMQRIGHTRLDPRHSGPDDKGMYTGVIDATNGYAYFVGNYLCKLDITGNLPVQIGPSLLTGQFAEAAVDLSAGYLYLPKAGTIFRYALGAGTNAVSSAGSLTLSEGASSALGFSMVIDDSNPNPTNHYGYVLCSGTPATVVKVALSTFTKVSSVTLNAGENSYAWGQIDTQKGYAYFATWASAVAPAVPQILKIKLTPGTNAPQRIGSVNLGATPVSLWAGSIDTLHGYLYYGTDMGSTNAETVYKVKLGDGDSLPTPVPFGGIQLQPGEIQLISSFIDPQAGYVYFGSDNTYPGRVYQLSLNGTNPPVEKGFLQLQPGTSTPPPNGTTILNATNTGYELPYGEVFLRSAVFDPLRGYAYFGQDSRPNQIVKIKVAKDPVPITLTNVHPLADGSFQFAFTNIAEEAFTALAATNLSLPLSNWNVLGSVTELSPGQYQFTDSLATNSVNRFYSIRTP